MSHNDEPTPWPQWIVGWTLIILACLLSSVFALGAVYWLTLGAWNVVKWLF